jgi:dihydroxyacetone kinase-like protein
MMLNDATLAGLVQKVAAAIIAEAEALTALDQAIGDGDHGINMRRGLEAVLADLPKLAGKPPGEALKAIGMTLVMKVGGASGPLYGTLVMEFGKHLSANPSRGELAQALQHAIVAVQARGKSEPGQKTMLDVLIPVQAALAAGEGAGAVKARAHAAAEATVPMLALRGRASFLGERSRGHMDPGARSAALLVASLCDGVGA